MAGEASKKTPRRGTSLHSRRKLRDLFDRKCDPSFQQQEDADNNSINFDRSLNNANNTEEQAGPTPHRPLIHRAGYASNHCVPSQLARRSFTSCQYFSCEYPFSYNVILPAEDEVVLELLKMRHKLTAAGFQTRLRLALNDSFMGEDGLKKRVLRVESRVREDLIKSMDLMNELFPSWKVWDNGCADASWQSHSSNIK